jgi:hypothetical protein
MIRNHGEMLMKRKLFALALLLAICAYGGAGHEATASPGNCTEPYCNAHPGATCICGPGTKLAGQMLTCPASAVDCNLE